MSKRVRSTQLLSIQRVVFLGYYSAHMYSRRRIPLIILLISLVLFAIWFFNRKPELISPVLEQKVSVTEAKKYQERARIKPIIKKNDDRPTAAPLMDNDLWVKALKAEQQCQATLQKILPNYELVDVKHPFYSKPEMVLTLAQQLMMKVMATKLDGDYYKAMLNLLEKSEQIGDAAQTYQALHKLDSCRDQQVLDFFDNIIKLANTASWSSEHKQQIVILLGKKLLNIQQDFFNTNDLLLFLDIGQKLAAYQLIGVLNRDYFIALEEQLLKEREYFEQLLNNPSMTAEDKWNGLKVHMKRLQDLGKEVTYVFEQAIEAQPENL